MTGDSLVVAQVVPPAVGGIRSHVRSLVPRLESLGVRSPVCSPDPELVDAPSGLVVVPIPARVRSASWPVALRRLRGALDGVDVVHAHGLKAAGVAETARGSRPLVVTVHNVVLPRGDGRPRRVAERLATAVLARADRLVVPSAAVLEDLPAQLRGAARVVVPVVDVAPPTRPTAEVRASLGVESGRPLVACVARLHPQKGLDTLASAWSRVRVGVPEAALVVVGEGPERPRLAAAVASWPEVSLVGELSPASDVLAAADVVVVTSTWEAVPLVLVEAVVLGTPVVSTDVGVAREVLDAPAAGTVVPVGDAGALADAVLDRLRVGARVAAAGGGPARPSWPPSLRPEVLTEQLVAVYRELQ